MRYIHALPAKTYFRFSFMMRPNRTSPFLSSLVLLLGISLAVSSCFPDPDFADNPVPRLIGFDDIYFKEAGALDTLVVRVRFQDGDGDYGIYPGQKDPIYFPVLNPDGSFQYFDPNDPNQPKYNCRDYERIDAVNPSDTTDKEDTIRAVYNEKSYNIAVTLYTKRGNELFQEIDFVSACQSPWVGQFFSLKDDEDIGNGKPLEGILQYAIRGTTFAQYRNDSLKIAVQIRDQADHLSNILESVPFTLKDITLNNEE